MQGIRQKTSQPRQPNPTNAAQNLANSPVQRQTAHARDRDNSITHPTHRAGSRSRAKRPNGTHEPNQPDHSTQSHQPNQPNPTNSVNPIPTTQPNPFNHPNQSQRLSHPPKPVQSIQIQQEANHSTRSTEPNIEKTHAKISTRNKGKKREVQNPPTLPAERQVQKIRQMATQSTRPTTQPNQHKATRKTIPTAQTRTKGQRQKHQEQKCEADTT